MAKTAISSDVKAANSKLAQFLRRREEEEMILQIGKRKPKQIREEKLPGGSGRWMLEPDYRAPTPLVDRPRTQMGATSFHFSYISISKEALPTVNGSPIQGTFGRARDAALEHSKYIERDGAAERSAGAQHAAYVERENAVENIDPAALVSEAIERQIASVINETPTESEAQILGLVDAIPDGIPSVFSNISDDPFLRQEYWRAVERSESTPRAHQIILDPEEALAWWGELPTTDRLDPEFQHHALMVAESYRQHMARPLSENETRERFVATPYHVSAEKAGKLIQQAQRMSSYNEAYPPFQFKSGRGGRVQFRLVAELPHELTAEDRALIVQNFCDHIGGLEERVNPDGSKQKIGMMYTAVVHAPDAHNDSRNYHLHVVAHDRPATYLAEYGMWDFEVEETFNHKGEDRIRRPFRQNKVGQVARVAPGEEKANAGIDFIPGLRRKFATITNSVLKARGVQRKLDPRKYTEMGIDRTPTDHLGTKAAALEAIGVPTAVGQLNALAIWGDAERAIRRDAAKARRTYQTSQADLEHLAKAIFTIDPAHASLPEFRAILAERARLVVDLASDREEVMAFDNMEAKAKSRAIRTRQTCIQFLAEIEAGNADRNTRMMRSVIEDRFKGAQAHINQIDEALAPHRQVLADAARNIEKREAKCAEIDAALQPIVATLKDRAQKYGIGNVLAAMEQAERQSKDKADEQTAGQPKVSNPDIQFDGKTLTIEALNAHIANDEARAESASADISQPSVPLQPTSIGGLPIVVPTIAPRKEHSDAERVDNHSTPDGLSPLRPEPDRVLSDLPREVIATNIDAPAETPRGSEAMAEGDLPLPSTPDKSVILETGQSALEKPVVQCRKPVDPALFDLPVQEPPIKPETTTADYSDWDELVNRVAADRIPVKAEKLPSGEMKFTVPSLSPEENALLHARRFSRRVGGRLAAIYERQQQEIQRLHRWIKSQGQEPGSLVLEKRTASLGGKVQSAVRTLFRHWGAHASVIGAIREEHDRRVELAKAIANQPVPEPKPADLDIEMRKAHAARSYPQPDQAYTIEVRDFLRLLHEAALEKDLQSAADKIHASVTAREDIYKHTTGLAVAYRGYVDGVDQRLLEWHRDDHRGR